MTKEEYFRKQLEVMERSVETSIMIYYEDAYDLFEHVCNCSTRIIEGYPDIE